jgi:hypothetical protein
LNMIGLSKGSSRHPARRAVTVLENEAGPGRYGQETTSDS